MYLFSIMNICPIKLTFPKYVPYFRTKNVIMAAAKNNRKDNKDETAKGIVLLDMLSRAFRINRRNPQFKITLIWKIFVMHKRYFKQHCIEYRTQIINEGEFF